MKKHNACKGHTDPSHLHHRQTKSLKSACMIAFAFMLIEIAGGLLANSLALISDALHLFTDVGAILLSLLALRISKKPRSANMSYGWERAEVLGALASALLLWGLSLGLIYESILRLANPPEVHGQIVFLIAAIGLVANLMMLKVLHPAHGHSLNVKAAYLHVIGDLLGSIGVILSGFLIWAFGWVLADPIVTILFTLGILYSASKIVKETTVVLMESAPAGIDPSAIQQDLEQLPDIREVHDLHVWSISSRNHALSVHLVAKDSRHALNAAHRLIEEKYGIHHMTIQVEDPVSFKPRYCYDCHKSR